MRSHLTDVTNIRKGQTQSSRHFRHPEKSSGGGGGGGGQGEAKWWKCVDDTIGVCTCRLMWRLAVIGRSLVGLAIKMKFIA